MIKEYVQQWDRWNGEYRNNSAITFEKPSGSVKHVLCLNQYDELVDDKKHAVDDFI